jgi:hypothetical protein
MSEKLCVFCKHLEYESGTGGDYPDPAQLSCRKKHKLLPEPGGFFYMQSIYDIDDFRKMILTAETCPDYDAPNK